MKIGPGPVLTSQGYNLIGNNTGCSFLPTAGDQVGTASAAINPQLGPLQNNGVGTFVCLPGGLTCPANSTLALLGGSPAIDAGNPQAPGSGPAGAGCAATDERGMARPLGAACDIGAFEADINVSPVSQAFPPEGVGVTSPAETITFTNYGSATLTITGITITGDFALDAGTTTCLTSTPLGAASNCAVGVTFTPTAAGTRTGTLTIASSDPSSPVTVSLSGEGNATAPFVLLTPTSLSFGSQLVGTSSTQGVTLTNQGNAPLLITGITTTGNFTQTNTCGSSVGAGLSCTISVTFAPTVVGTQVGTLTIADNAAGSPRSVILSGVGIGVGLSGTALTFGNQALNTTSAAQTVTLTNTSTSNLSITAVSASGDFALDPTTTCSGSTTLGPSGTCTVVVTFTPTATGTRTGTVTITDDGPNSPRSIALVGAGVTTQLIIVNTTAQIASSPRDCTLGDAITAANTDAAVNGCAAGSGADTITLPAGTYHLTRINNSSRSAATPDISTAITIQGAGAGTTILERDASAPTFEILSLTNGTLTLNDVTLKGGAPAVWASYYYYYYYTTLNVNRCTFDSNPAGAINFYSYYGNLTIDSSTFTNNTNPNSYGAALYFSGPVLTITNSLFSGNVATYYAGALYISGGTISIANSSFVNNSSSSSSYYYYGGAIYISGGTSAAINSCNFSGNSGGYGGAVYDYNVPLTVLNSAFTNNSAASDGGALYLYYGAANTSITGSTFSGNTASGAGGAIYRDYGTTGQVTMLTNTTISGNTASNWGGGIAIYGYYSNYGGGLELNNVTISNNTAQNGSSSAGGGGLALVALNASDNYKFENSIIAGNTDATNVAPDCSTVQIGSGVLTSQGYNLVGNDTGCTFTAATGDQVGTGSSPINPLLGPVVNNGGATFVCGPAGQTCPPNSTQALLAGSPAIDTGNPATPGSGAPACAATDERGVVSRPLGTACDIGAYELSGTAAAILSTSSLTFGDQLVGSTSSPQTVTLTNPASAPVAITSIVTSGDFAETNTCGDSLAAGASCTISVFFAPTAAGTRTGLLTLTDGASNSPQTASLSGTGAGSVPVAGLSPNSLSFADQPLGSSSGAQTVTLTNSGTGTLTISSLTASGDFAQTNNCSSSVAADASCTISVTFTPTALGARPGAITITDNASGSPHTVILVGTGLGPAVSVSLTLTFPNQNLNATSAPQTVTVANSGTSLLTVSSVAISGDFAQTNTCVGTVAAGASCPISVTFTPTTTGQRTGSLAITDNAQGSPHVVAISGKGVLPAVSLSAASLTFAGNPVGMDCPTKTVTLSNPGDGQLNISSIVASAEFLQTNDCGLARDPGAGCVISVKFQPAAVGTTTGTVKITSDAPGSPHTVVLTGNGTPACALLTSAPLATVLRGADSVDFTISDQKPSCTPDPIQLTCTVNNPATCKLAQATIQPTGSTTLTVANLKALGADPVTVEVVKRSDFRVAAVDMQVRVSDFAMTEYPQAATVAAGRTANYSLTLASVNALKGSVQMGCQGAPAGATCTVTPGQVTLDGATPVQVTVSVTTTARSQGVPRVPPAPPQAPRWVWPLALTMLTGLILASRRRRPALILAALLLMAVAWAACGGGGRMVSTTSTGTPAGSYSIQVTGTYTEANGATSTLSHIVNLSLTVN